MSTSKHIDKICIAAIAITLVITILFMCGGSLGITIVAREMPYETTLFDTSYVHTVDIVMNDWDSFIDTCENEEYSSCTVVIDGEKHSNVAIRAKGNTSLSTVSTLNSDRYSFKLEFDHYDSTNALDGLDKLCLNNLIQDNTMMKDYIVYQMMNDFGVDSPLCSFTYLTVNGEDWGLYLAVEGIEDSFLSRNYGSQIGDLYKPDSISNGGGRGNGKNINMEDFDFGNTKSSEIENQWNEQDSQQGEQTNPMGQGVFDPSTQGGQFNPEGQGEFNPSMHGGQFNPEGQGEFNPSMHGGQFNPEGQGEFNPSMHGGQFNPEGQEGFDPNTQRGQFDPNNRNSGTEQQSDRFDPSDNQVGFTPDGNIKQGNMLGGMGSDDVKLKYIDDNPDSYSNIFDNAKTDVTSADKSRLIKALKNLSNYTDLENTVDIDEVIRYFVVHNFVCNGDSYTGSMIHNYYLYEEDGILSMIPWDYNLAYGTFQGSNASDTINTSIDSPISGGTVDDRPMLGWIFSSDEYTEQYHKLFSEFIEKWFANGELEKLISDTAKLIRSYVEKDPTKFCTTEEFDTGVTALTQFVTLRAEAVEKQLSGDSTKVDTGSLNLSDMGTMNMGGGGMDNPVMQNMNLFSFVTLKDSGGNIVDIATIIPSNATIVSITLSDESTVDLTNANMQTLMGVDVNRIVRATDSDGNCYDLSGYSISASIPTMPDGEGGNIPSIPSGQNESGENDAVTDNQIDIQQQGQNRFPSGNNGQIPNRNGGNEQIEPDTQNEITGVMSESTKWILVGISFLVLAVGVLIAIKKKY